MKFLWGSLLVGNISWFGGGGEGDWANFRMLGRGHPPSLSRKALGNTYLFKVNNRNTRKKC